jgi:DNA-binding transcriptional MerR regulator
MTTGELARRLGVHINTIRLWTGEYAPYLSESAIGKGRTRRNLSDRDALILATVAELRNQGLTHERVVEALDAGRLVESLPEAPSPEEIEARERVALIPVADLHRALDQIRVMQSEIERLIQERDKAQIDREAANQQIAELQHRIGMLEGQVSERLSTRQTLQIAAVFIVGLLVFLALAVLYFGSRGGG